MFKICYQEEVVAFGNTFEDAAKEFFTENDLDDFTFDELYMYETEPWKEIVSGDDIADFIDEEVEGGEIDGALEDNLPPKRLVDRINAILSEYYGTFHEVIAKDYGPTETCNMLRAWEANHL